MGQELSKIPPWCILGSGDAIRNMEKEKKHSNMEEIITKDNFSMIGIMARECSKDQILYILEHLKMVCLMEKVPLSILEVDKSLRVNLKLVKEQLAGIQCLMGAITMANMKTECLMEWVSLDGLTESGI